MGDAMTTQLFRYSRADTEVKTIDQKWFILMYLL